MTHQVRVIFGDTDQLGVVYYANYLRYFEGKLSKDLDEGFALPDKAAAKKKPTKKKDSTPAYRRIDAVIAIVGKIPKKGMTKDEIMKATNELVVKNGGKSNNRTNDIHSNALKPLVAFGILTCDKKVYKKA